ncbi:MAG: haloacid dehalogenase-like hydrolase [Bacilli bacterium]|nr:haloacid dehalogenase-like hydrolase [Bacilli bacterium]
MDAYDFDGTIYKGNSSVDFFAFCMFRNYKVIPYAPASLYGLVKYKLGLLNLTEGDKSFCEFLVHIKNLDAEVEIFWNKHIRKIYPWYLAEKKEDNLIVTSSPTFLIAPICKKLGVNNFIGTEVDIKNGNFIGKVCNKEEKRRRYTELYGDQVINQFCTDSFDDEPLFGVSEKVYMLKKGQRRRII